MGKKSRKSNSFQKGRKNLRKSLRKRNSFRKGRKSLRKSNKNLSVNNVRRRQSRSRKMRGGANTTTTALAVGASALAGMACWYNWKTGKKECLPPPTSYGIEEANRISRQEKSRELRREQHVGNIDSTSYGLEKGNRISRQEQLREQLRELSREQLIGNIDDKDVVLAGTPVWTYEKEGSVAKPTRILPTSTDEYRRVPTLYELT